MSQVHCSRCGATTGGLARAPLPGRVGQLVLEHVCSVCWDEWRGVQVKLINEYRIDVMNPEHYGRLMREMSAFLSLADEATDEH